MLRQRTRGMREGRACGAAAAVRRRPAEPTVWPGRPYPLSTPRLGDEVTVLRCDGPPGESPSILGSDLPWRGRASLDTLDHFAKRAREEFHIVLRRQQPEVTAVEDFRERAHGSSNDGGRPLARIPRAPKGTGPPFERRRRTHGIRRSPPNQARPRNMPQEHDVTSNPQHLGLGLQASPLGPVADRISTQCVCRFGRPSRSRAKASKRYGRFFCSASLPRKPRRITSRGPHGAGSGTGGTYGVTRTRPVNPISRRSVFEQGGLDDDLVECIQDGLGLTVRSGRPLLLRPIGGAEDELALGVEPPEGPVCPDTEGLSEDHGLRSPVPSGSKADEDRVRPAPATAPAPG